MKKRMLSAFLALCMMLTMTPAAFAAGQERTTEMPVTTSAADVSDVTTYSTAVVAEYDGTRYPTLEAAVSAANTDKGGTITLLSNVTLTQAIGITADITINGGGHTILGNVNSPDVNIYVTGNDVKTVTISDVTVQDFGGNAPTTPQWGLFKVYNTNDDTVFKAIGVEASNFNRAAFDIRSGTFEITDCIIDCKNDSTSRLTKGVLAQDATGTISGTTITNAASEGVGDWNTNAIETWGDTVLSVTGCTLGQPGAEVKNGISMNAGTGASSVTVSDTTIVAVDRIFKLTPDASGTGTGTASVDIQSGDYSGTFKINQGSVSGKGCEIEVNGGTFDTSAADYLASNLKYEVNNNGSYTYYESIDDAMDAAGSTGSINQVPDVTYHTVTLTYDIRTDTVSVAANDQFTLPNIVRPGYELTGWSDGTTTHNAGAVVTITSDVTFTAQWTPVVQHTVTYDHGYDGIKNTAYVTNGDTVTLPAAPTRGGYTFGGWSDGTTTHNAGAVVTITSDVTFTAQWTPNQPGGGGGGSAGGGGGGGVATHTITVDPVDNGSITVSPLRASSGDTVTITVTPDTGYALDAVTVTDANGNEIALTDVGNGSYTFVMPDSAVSINATFAVESTDEPSDMLFRDVPDNAWYYDAVDYVYRNGMMVGTSLTRFSPEMTTTRGMIVTILYRLEGEPDAPATSFIDVEPNMYYADGRRRMVLSMA